MALLLLFGWLVGRFGLWSYVQTWEKRLLFGCHMDAIWLVSNC